MPTCTIDKIVYLLHLEIGKSDILRKERFFIEASSLSCARDKIALVRLLGNNCYGLELSKERKILHSIKKRRWIVYNYTFPVKFYPDR